LHDDAVLEDIGKVAGVKQVTISKHD
jgi:hypothetical protein